jgi:hypothetical protein
LSAERCHNFKNLHRPERLESSVNTDVILICLAAALLAAPLLVAFSLTVTDRSWIPLDLLSTLPAPDAAAPFIMMSSSGAEFPLYAARLFLESSTVSPGGVSPVASVIPLLTASDQTAVVVTERKNGLAVYGAFTIPPEERAAMLSGDLPSRWRLCFDNPEVRVTDLDSAIQIRADNIASPLYVGLPGESARVSDSLYDMEKMLDSAGRNPANPAGNAGGNWSIGGSWEGRLKLSDGGVLHSMTTGGGTASIPLEVELSWKSSEETGESGVRMGRILWSVKGIEDLAGRQFMKSVKEYDWSESELFIPDPLIASLGINISPPRDVSSFPSPIRYMSDQFQRLGMKRSEIQSLLSGVTVFSVGGNTQVLWFDLPGLVLDMPDRGDESKKLIERFWSDLFLGAELREVPGYEYGGVTGMPFTILAAGNGKDTVIGLTEPDVERNPDVPELLLSEKSAIGWLFLDLPKLGMALADMPSINAMLNPDGEDIVDDESTNRLRETMNEMGRLFVVWDEGAAGHAVWYY